MFWTHVFVWKADQMCCGLWPLHFPSIYMFVRLRSYVYLLIIHYFPTCGTCFNDECEESKGWHSMKYLNTNHQENVDQTWGRSKWINMIVLLFVPFSSFGGHIAAIYGSLSSGSFYCIPSYGPVCWKKKKKRTLFKSKPWAKPEPCVLYGLPLFSRGVLKECTMFLGCCFLTEFILCLRCLLLKTKGQCLYQSLGSLSALV